jgi:hypothetical protein
MKKGWRGIGVGPRIAAFLIVVSLGLPWFYAQGTDSSYIPGWFVAGYCTTHYDPDGWASSDCVPGTIGAPILLPGTQGTTGSGASHTSRFGIVFALVMIAIAARTGKKKCLVIGAVGMAFVTGLSSGLGGGTTSGVFVGWMAIALLLWSGLDKRPQRWSLGTRPRGSVTNV